MLSRASIARTDESRNSNRREGFVRSRGSRAEGEPGEESGRAEAAPTARGGRGRIAERLSGSRRTFRTPGQSDRRFSRNLSLYGNGWTRLERSMAEREGFELTIRRKWLIR